MHESSSLTLQYYWSFGIEHEIIIHLLVEHESSSLTLQYYLSLGIEHESSSLTLQLQYVLFISW